MRLIDIIEPYLAFMRFGFAVVLLCWFVLCLVDLIRRFRQGSLQYSSRHLFLLLLITAHACSVAAIGRAGLKTLPVVLDLLLTAYIFGPITLLFGFGCYEATRGRPYYLLVALLYLWGFRFMSSL